VHMIEKWERYRLQLHTGSFLAHEIDEVLNGTTKPGGGFWTSTFHPQAKYASDWVKFWTSLKFKFGIKDFEKAVLLEVSPEAKVCHIDGVADLEKLIFKYPRVSIDSLKRIPIDRMSSGTIDWEALARDYDGVHLTRNAAAEIHEMDRFAGWDCESTCWFKRVFVAATPYSEPLIREDVAEAIAPSTDIF